MTPEQVCALRSAETFFLCCLCRGNQPLDEDVLYRMCARVAPDLHLHVSPRPAHRRSSSSGRSLDSMPSSIRQLSPSFLCVPLQCDERPSRWMGSASQPAAPRSRPLTECRGAHVPADSYTLRCTYVPHTFTWLARACVIVTVCARSPLTPCWFPLTCPLPPLLIMRAEHFGRIQRQRASLEARSDQEIRITVHRLCDRVRLMITTVRRRTCHWQKRLCSSAGSRTGCSAAALSNPMQTFISSEGTFERRWSGTDHGRPPVWPHVAGYFGRAGPSHWLSRNLYIVEQGPGSQAVFETQLGNALGVAIGTPTLLGGPHRPRPACRPWAACGRTQQAGQFKRVAECTIVPAP